MRFQFSASNVMRMAKESEAKSESGFGLGSPAGSTSAEVSSWKFFWSEEVSKQQAEESEGAMDWAQDAFEPSLFGLESPPTSRSLIPTKQESCSPDINWDAFDPSIFNSPPGSPTIKPLAKNLASKLVVQEELVFVRSLTDLADLKIVLETDGRRYVFLGVSKSLGMPSKVFSRMLDPNSRFQCLQKETVNGTSMRVLNLFDDNPTALEIILSIFHLRYSDIPRRLESLELMHGVASICDKYNCAAVVSPWVASWAENCEQWADGIDKFNTLESWLDVARIFNAYPEWRNVLIGVLRVIVNHTYSLDMQTNILKHRRYPIHEGRWGFALPASLDVTEIPERIKEYIIAERKNRHIAMLQMLQNFLGTVGLMEDYALSATNRCLVSQCTAIAAGSLMVSLRAKDLWKYRTMNAEQPQDMDNTTLAMLNQRIQDTQMTTFAFWNISDEKHQDKGIKRLSKCVQFHMNPFLVTDCNIDDLTRDCYRFCPLSIEMSNMKAQAAKLTTEFLSPNFFGYHG